MSALSVSKQTVGIRHRGQANRTGVENLSHPVTVLNSAKIASTIRMALQAGSSKYPGSPSWVVRLPRGSRLDSS